MLINFVITVIDKCLTFLHICMFFFVVFCFSIAKTHLLFPSMTGTMKHILLLVMLDQIKNTHISNTAS